MKDTLISRRKMLQGTGLAAGAAFLGLGLDVFPAPKRIGAANAREEGAKRPWYELGLLRDDIQDNQLLFLMGLTYTGMADIGECLDTASRIAEGDDFSWYREWLKTAERLNGFW